MTHTTPCQAVEDGLGCETCDAFEDAAATAAGHEDGCDYTYKATMQERLDHYKTPCIYSDYAGWMPAELGGDERVALRRRMLVEGVQVSILPLYESVGGEAGVREALRSVGLPEGPIEEVDEERGVWMVTIPLQDWATLESEGYRRWSSAHYVIEAEMP